MRPSDFLADLHPIQITCPNCKWIGPQSQLVHIYSHEIHHPRNRGKTPQDTPYLTPAEICPLCGKWIYADHQPLP